METLRSLKTLTGPDLRIPSLTFRAGFEARFGAEDWAGLDRIPRLTWIDCLRWHRRVPRMEVRNGHRVTRVHPQSGHVPLEMETPDRPARVLARRVVLVTGRGGLGGPSVPDIVAALPRDRGAYSPDENGYADLAGKRVAVIGAGASAMDSAATALEAGAARVGLLIRRKAIPRINRGKGMGNPGYVACHTRLPDDWEWRI